MNVSNIKQIYFCTFTPEEVKNQLLQKYNLQPYNNVNEPAIFLGCNYEDDRIIIRKHNSTGHIIWFEEQLNGKSNTKNVRNRNFLNEINNKSNLKHYNVDYNPHPVLENLLYFFNIQNISNMYNIKQVYFCSFTTEEVKKQVLQKYNLQPYNNINQSAIFLGCNYEEDRNVIRKHNSEGYIFFYDEQLNGNKKTKNIRNNNFINEIKNRSNLSGYLIKDYMDTNAQFLFKGIKKPIEENRPLFLLNKKLEKESIDLLDITKVLLQNKIFKKKNLIDNKLFNIVKELDLYLVDNINITSNKTIYNPSQIELFYNIPKILFTYWDMSNLSFLHFLTLYTIKKQNPDFKIVLYYPKKRVSANTWKSYENKDKYKNTNYIKYLKQIDIITIEIDFENDLPDIPYYLSEVIKSDFFRLYICKEVGGIWFDMDTFWVGSLKEKLIFNEKNYYTDLGILNKAYNNLSDNIINNENGKVFNNSYFVMCSKNQDNQNKNAPHFAQYILLHNKNSKLVNLLYNSCINNLDCDKYESIGTPMFSKILSKYMLEDKEFNYNKSILNINIFSPFKSFEMDLLFEKKVIKNIDKSVCLHWFNGSPYSKKFINEFTHLNFDKIPDITFKDILNKNLSDHDKNFLKNLEINTYKKEYTKKISIVIAYYNRKDQFIKTLQTIKKSKIKNLEIIVVDDASYPEQCVNSFIDNVKDNLNIKVITIDDNKKKWINPCIPYNLGFKEATGDIIVIQNPEVMHVGDCLDFIIKNLELGDWLSFNCYGTPSLEYNENIIKLNDDQIYEVINKNNFRIGGNSVMRDDVGGWVNHFNNHFVAYHYLAAIHKEDLLKKMNGGFNEIFKDGIGCDDDDFIKRLIYNKFNFKISRFEQNIPFCIHLYHEKPKQLKENDYKINKNIFITECKKMNLTPENNIEVAPKNEIPMFFRQLV